MGKDLKELNKAYRKTKDEAVRERLGQLIDDFEESDTVEKEEKTEVKEPEAKKEEVETKEEQPEVEEKKEEVEKTEDKEKPTSNRNEEYEEIILGMNKQIETLSEKLDKMSGNFGQKQSSGSTQAKNDDGEDLTALYQKFKSRQY